MNDAVSHSVNENHWLVFDKQLVSTHNALIFLFVQVITINTINALNSSIMKSHAYRVEFDMQCSTFDFNMVSCLWLVR